MKTSIRQKMKKFIVEYSKNGHWRNAALCMAAVVAVLTVYALILPAITMGRDAHCGMEEHKHTAECYEKQLVCGKEENGEEKALQKVLSCSLQLHQHKESCYDNEGKIICGYADYVVHQHSENCYDESGSLVCALPEVKAHTHDASCYTEEKRLICTAAETAGHIHTEDCYTMVETGNINCIAPEEEGHVHTEECYEKVKTLTCGQEEVPAHVHTDGCYETVRQYVCGKPEVILHKHDEVHCYSTDENGNRYLSCGMLEVLSHEHDDKCFREVQTESEGHVHTEECYEDVLICEKTEHTHDDSCFDKESVETAAAGAETAETEQTVWTAQNNKAEINAAEVECGKEEHIHTEACYSNKGELICGYEDHTHELSCYPETVQTEVNEVNRTIEALPSYEELSEKFAVYEDAGDEDGYNAYFREIAAQAKAAYEAYDALDAKLQKFIPAENVELVTNYTSFWAMDTMDLITSTDLADFLTGVILRDSQGNVVETGGTLNVGATYTVSFAFAERPEVRQISGNTVTYTIPANLKCKDFAPRQNVVIVNGSGHIYTYEVKDNQLTVKFQDNIYNEVQDLALSIVLEAEVTSAGSSGRIDINISDGTTIGFDINNDPKPTLEKKAKGYDAAARKAKYEIVITASEGTITDLTLADSLDANGVLQYNKDSLNLVVTRIDKNGVSSIIQNINPQVTNNTLNMSLPDLNDGEMYSITYEAELKEGSLDANGEIDTKENNQVVLRGTGANEFSLDDKATVTINSGMVAKTGGMSTTDGQDKLKWTIRVGDGYENVAGAQIRDTLGEGQTIYEGTRIRVNVINAVTKENCGQMIIDWEDVTVSDDKRTIEYTLPTEAEIEAAGIRVPEHFYFETYYYANYEMPEGQISGTFENTVTTIIRDKEYETTGTATGKVPLGTIEKTVEAKDGYLYYKIEYKNIPYQAGGTPLRIIDYLRFKNAGGNSVHYYVENVPQNMVVTLDGEALPKDSGTNYYSLRTYENHDSTELNRFYITFNSNPGAYYDESKITVKADSTSTLTVTYQIPMTALVYTDDAYRKNITDEIRVKDENGNQKTIKDLIEEGKSLNNDGYANHSGSIYVHDDVDYTDENVQKPIVKSHQINPDGTITYRVVFENWVGSDFYTPLIKDPSTLAFRDEFNENMEYVPNSFMVEVYKAQVHTLNATYKYTGENPTPNSPNVIEATVNDFNERTAAEGWSSGSYITLLKGMERRLDDDYLGSSRSYSLEFVYTLRVKKDVLDNATASMITLDNHAVIEADEKTYDTTHSFDYKTGLMDKTAVISEEGSNKVSFTIDLNPNCKKLIPPESIEETLTLEDTMSENLSVRVSTIKITAADTDGVSEDITMQTGIVLNGKVLTLSNLPDERHIVITYDADITSTGDNISVSNSAEITSVAGIETTYENEFDVHDISSEAIGHKGKMTVMKKDAETNVPLDGAKFALYMIPKNNDSDPRTDSIENPGGVDDIIHTSNGLKAYFIGFYVTGTSGTGRVEIENQYLLDGYSYILVETKAPNGYMQPEDADARTEFGYYEAAENPDATEDILTVSFDGAITISNDAYNVELPETGGTGTIPYTMAGITLIVAAALFYIEGNKKQKKIKG